MKISFFKKIHEDQNKDRNYKNCNHEPQRAIPSDLQLIDFQRNFVELLIAQLTQP